MAKDLFSVAYAGNNMRLDHAIKQKKTQLGATVKAMLIVESCSVLAQLLKEQLSSLGKREIIYAPTFFFLGFIHQCIHHRN